MADVIKTWPGYMDREKVMRIFTLSSHERWRPDDRYYFVIGKGKPKQTIERLWFVHQGEILGCFVVDSVQCNVGEFPKLRSLENRESEWQIKPDRWVAICKGPFLPLTGDEPVYHDAFRGFRYFDFNSYIQTMEAKIPI
jgi:hypothetical protein